MTGILTSFLPATHPGIPSLESLSLWNTQLNEKDVKHLSEIVNSNKLPQLRNLDLSQNTQTKCFTSFLKDPHPGIFLLETLRLSESELSKEDLRHQTNLIRGKKLPKQHKLNLCGNVLLEKEAEMKELIESCMLSHGKNLEIRCYDTFVCNLLSNEAKKKLLRFCTGSNVTLSI